MTDARRTELRDRFIALARSLPSVPGALATREPKPAPVKVADHVFRRRVQR